MLCWKRQVKLWVNGTSLFTQNAVVTAGLFNSITDHMTQFILFQPVVQFQPLNWRNFLENPKVLPWRLRNPGRVMLYLLLKRVFWNLIHLNAWVNCELEKSQLNRYNTSLRKWEIKYWQFYFRSLPGFLKIVVSLVGKQTPLILSSKVAENIEMLIKVGILLIMLIIQCLRNIENVLFFNMYYSC